MIEIPEVSGHYFCLCNSNVIIIFITDDKSVIDEDGNELKYIPLYIQKIYNKPIEMPLVNDVNWL